MCKMLCLELLRIERRKIQGLCPRGACVLFEECKHNAHEIMDHGQCDVGKEFTHYLFFFFEMFIFIFENE